MKFSYFALGLKRLATPVLDYGFSSMLIQHLSFFSLQVYYVVNKVLDASSTNVIETDLYLPQPVVTSRFVVNVVEANPSVVFRLDIIGLNPAKKYSIDPMLDQFIYQDCKRLNCFLNLNDVSFVEGY
jgi:hypothetical protein